MCLTPWAGDECRQGQDEFAAVYAAAPERKWHLECSNPGAEPILGSPLTCPASRAPTDGHPMTIATLGPRHARRVLFVLTLAALSACASTAKGKDIGNISEAEEPATLEFRNESLAQADVFITTSGSGSRRIGTVFAGRTETLTVPREVTGRGTVTVFARLLARTRTPSTGSIAISPGTHLSIRLPMDERSLYVLPAN
jgi:hypothetical protein